MSQKRVMQRPIGQRCSTVSFLKHALDLWPYLFIVVSVTGLAYSALKAAQ